MDSPSSTTRELIRQKLIERLEQQGITVDRLSPSQPRSISAPVSPRSPKSPRVIKGTLSPRTMNSPVVRQAILAALSSPKIDHVSNQMQRASLDSPMLTPRKMMVQSRSRSVMWEETDIKHSERSSTPKATASTSSSSSSADVVHEELAAGVLLSLRTGIAH